MGFIGLMVMALGCAHAPPLKVIAQDRTVSRIKAGTDFKAPVDGWFVPDARWLEMREAISAEISQKDQAEPGLK